MAFLKSYNGWHFSHTQQVIKNLNITKCKVKDWGNLLKQDFFYVEKRLRNNIHMHHFVYSNENNNAYL